MSKKWLWVAWVLGSGGMETRAQDSSDAVFNENEVTNYRLNMAASDWQAMIDTPSDRTWRRAQLVWKGETYDDVAVRPAGHHTLIAPGNPKPGLRLQFDEFVPGRTFHGLPSIKLDGLSQDSSMIRERVAYKVYRDFGIVAPRYVHCQFYVNGEHKGLYGVEERVNKTFVTRYFGATVNQVYEYDRDGRNDPYDSEFRWLGSDPALYIPFPWEPKVESVGDQAEAVRDLIDTVNHSSTQAGGIFNVEQFIKLMAVETIQGNWDGYCAVSSIATWTNNLNLYRNPQDNLFLLIPWDPTLTYGLHGFYPSDRDITYGFEQRVLTRLLILEQPANLDRYRQRLAQLIDGVNETTRQHGIIDSISNQVGVDGSSIKAWVTNRNASVRAQLGTVPPPPPDNNAVFVSQSVPGTMTAGQSYWVSVTMQNTGTTTWTDADVYRLASRNPDNATTWGPYRILLDPGESIGPGQNKTFSFTVTAPSVAGTYNFQWKMRQNGDFFGSSSQAVAVVVSAAPLGNNAQFVAQSVPPTMTAGQTYSVSVAMKNTGDTTWTDTTHRLGSKNPSDNMTWGLNRVSMNPGQTKAPGETKTFMWDVTAPATPGTYNFQWQMRESGVDWFGESSPNVVVTVNPTGAATSQSFQDGVFPTASYAGMRDVRIIQDDPGTNHGLSSRLIMDGDEPSGTGRNVFTLIKWDISSIPPGSRVESAYIEVYVTNPTAETYEMYRMGRNWSESQATWEEYRTGNPWEIPGAYGVGDRGSTVRGTITSGAVGFARIQMNAAGVALVQAWVNDPAGNTGVIIANTGNADGLGFDSRQSATPAQRPRLKVSFVPGTGTQTRVDSVTETLLDPGPGRAEGMGGSSSDGGGTCGALGVEALLAIGFLALRRRRSGILAPP